MLTKSNPPPSGGSHLFNFLVDAARLKLASLKCQDIELNSEMSCFCFSDNGERQHLKNESSFRQVPIHRYLIDIGFIDYVKLRRSQNQIQLFDYKPRVKALSGQKIMELRWGKTLTNIGFNPQKRPTAYSLLHPFIDELTTGSFSARPKTYTDEDVINAANELIQRGKDPSRLRIKVSLGRGKVSTIQSDLDRQLKERRITITTETYQRLRRMRQWLHSFLTIYPQSFKGS